MPCLAVSKCIVLRCVSLAECGVGVYLSASGAAYGANGIRCVVDRAFTGDRDDGLQFVEQHFVHHSGADVGVFDFEWSARVV